MRIAYQIDYSNIGLVSIIGSREGQKGDEG